MMVRTYVLGVFACGTLAACGPGATSNVPVQQLAPAEGYATISSVIGGGSSFSAQTARRVVFLGSGATQTPTFSDEDVSISFSPSANTATLELNGNTYVMAQDPMAPSFYSNSEGSIVVSLNGSGTVLLLNLEISDDDPSASAGTENFGKFVAGYQTAPSEVQAATGTAVFAGTTTVDFFEADNRGIGDGTISMTADFDANAVYGTINVTEAASNFGPAVPDFAIDFNGTQQSNITGNGFGGNISTIVTPSGGNTASISGGALQGKFYGANAASIGGTYWITGTSNGSAMLVQGAFASN